MSNQQNIVSPKNSVYKLQIDEVHDLDIEIEAVDFYKFPNGEEEEEEKSSSYSSDSPRMPIE